MAWAFHAIPATPYRSSGHGPAASRRSSSRAAQPHELWIDQRKKDLREELELSVYDALPSFQALVSEAERCCEIGRLGEAIKVLSHMDQLGYVPSNGLYWSLLKTCKKKKALDYASHLHSHMGSLIVDPSNFVLIEYLISTLVSCGAFDVAIDVFHKLPHKTTYSWTALIFGYVERGSDLEALKLYELMLKEGFQPNEFTCVSLLKACTSTGNPNVGRTIHDYARENGYISNAFVGSALVTMYGKCGSIADAEDVFVTMQYRGVVAWTALLVAYLEYGQGIKALRLYRQMREECLVSDEQTFAVALQACCIIAEKEKGNIITEGVLHKVMALEIGMALHADARRKGFDLNLYIGNLLVFMYGKCGNIPAAESVFGGFSQKNVPLWNAMLSAYSEQGHSEKTLQLFKFMHEEGHSPEERSFVTSLHACTLLTEKEEVIFIGKSLIKVKSLNIGGALHIDANKKGFGSNLYVSSALLNMYGKCGDLMTAERLFNGLSHGTIVSWNAMLSAYVEQGQVISGLHLYQQMQAEGIGVDDITLINLLQIAGQTGNVHFCRQTYKEIVFKGFDLRPLVAFNLIYAFGKCASMVDALGVFNSLPFSSVVSWNALISGYALHGDSNACSFYFQGMHQIGLKPDHETYFSLLTACAYSGQVRKGVSYFDSMGKEDCVIPEIEHYETMMNLFGYAGQFSKVQQMLSKLPVQPTVSLWLRVLEVCVKHGNLPLGKQAFDCAVRLQPKEAAAYMLMSTIYANAGLQDLANQVEISRQTERALKKEISWCEHQQSLISFSTGDQQKLQQHHMYRYLLELVRQLKGEAELSVSKHLPIDAAVDKLGPSLCGHSQLLALAFVLLNPPVRKPILVKKDSYICQDCHTLIKLISLVKNLCIVIIENKQVHSFMGGKCSCKDYFYSKGE